MSETETIVNDTTLGDSDSVVKENQIILYKKRWFILFLFASYSFLNAYQWIHLNIISEKVVYFWKNSLPNDKLKTDQAINWLSLVYMLAYIPFIIPAMWILKHQGLRRTSLIASFLNALGAWIKCIAISRDGTRFSILMTGQTICAIAQIFILGIPAHLAAVWFGSNEVSTATALGVFGNQLGIGFGFVIPSLIFPSNTSNQTMEIYQERFSFMFYTGAIVMTVLFILIVFTFDKKPKTPPSWGQIALAENSPDFDYKTSLRMLFTDVNFVSLYLSYGINTGIFYSISTILNIVLQQYFKNASKLIGIAGLLMIISGIIAAALIGFILDKTKAFKLCIVIIYVSITISMGAFTGSLCLHSWTVVYIMIILLGFFMTGYLPLGFELAAEMTYPINEGLTSGLLNLSAQIFGIIFTYVGTIALDKYNALYTNVSFVIFLFIGTILTIFMRIDLKRQRAQLVVSRIKVCFVNSKYGKRKVENKDMGSESESLNQCKN